MPVHLNFRMINVNWRLKSILQGREHDGWQFPSTATTLWKKGAFWNLYILSTESTEYRCIAIFLGDSQRAGVPPGDQAHEAGGGGGWQAIPAWSVVLVHGESLSSAMVLVLQSEDSFIVQFHNKDVWKFSRFLGGLLSCSV